MGKYKGDTPRQPYRAPEDATAAQIGSFARHTAIHFLNRHVGGRWNWDEKNHRFEAGFNPEIAHAIQLYFAPYSITLSGDTLNKEARLFATTAQFAAIENISALRVNSQSLAKTYQTLLSSTVKAR
ncbi:MAG: hypothetical protein ACOYNL_04210 [Rickettsiales bacterium]